MSEWKDARFKLDERGRDERLLEPMPHDAVLQAVERAASGAIRLKLEIHDGWSDPHSVLLEFPPESKPVFWAYEGLVVGTIVFNLEVETGFSTAFHGSREPRWSDPTSYRLDKKSWFLSAHVSYGNSFVVACDSKPAIRYRLVEN